MLMAVSYLHCALASGAVYCNRSCLCVCVFVAGGRCQNLIQPARAHVCVSLSAFFILLYCYFTIIYGRTGRTDEKPGETTESNILRCSVFSVYDTTRSEPVREARFVGRVHVACE